MSDQGKPFRINQKERRIFHESRHKTEIDTDFFITYRNNKVYDGTTSAAIDANNLTLNGIVGDDEVSLWVNTIAFETPDIGSGKTVNLAGASLYGDDYFNYTLSLDGAPTATADITAAGGNHSNGGSTPKPEQPRISTGDNTKTVSTTANTTIGTDGSASASVTAAQIADVISKLTEESGQQSTENRTIMINTTGTGSSKVETTIPKEAFSSIASSKADTLTIKTGIASVSFDKAAISAINSGAAGNEVKVSVSEADKSALTESVQNMVGIRPVYDFTITSGNDTISGFGGGTATISVPYTPAAGEDINEIVIYYISDSNELVTVPNCVYNPETGTVTFTASHFSFYAVGYHDVHFTDVSGWYADYVNFLAARDIINGTEKEKFSPNSSITRAQLVMILAKMSGDDLSSYTSSSFSDVKSSYWYSKAVEWAYKNGIITGANGRFSPNEKINRQDIAVMLSRYAEKVNYTLPDTNEKKAFTDTDRISSYASGAVTSIQQAGIIDGNTDGSFGPNNSATRAQAAKMITLLLEGIVD